MKTPLFKHASLKLLAISCLIVALIGNQARAAGNGDSKPTDIPRLNALSMQIEAINQSLLDLVVAGGSGPDPTELPRLETLASRLTEADLDLGLAMLGSGTPDPRALALTDALVGLRIKAVNLAGDVERALLMAGAGEPDPIEVPIVNTLKFMVRTARMVIGRVNYVLCGTVQSPVE